MTAIWDGQARYILVSKWKRVYEEINGMLQLRDHVSQLGRHDEPVLKICPEPSALKDLPLPLTAVKPKGVSHAS